MKTACLLVLALAATAIAADVEVDGFPGYRSSFDVEKEAWGYVTIELAASDMGANVTNYQGYKIHVATDITEAFTLNLWGGRDKITDKDAAGEIDMNARGQGRGNREGTIDIDAADAAGLGTYIISCYAECEACSTVTTDMDLYIEDAGGNMVKYFNLVHNMRTIPMEVNQDAITMFGKTDSDKDLYFDVRVSNELNSVKVIGAMDMDIAAAADADTEYPTGSATEGDFVTGPMTIDGATMSYWGFSGVKETAGAIELYAFTGIGSVPDAAGFVAPSFVVAAIAAVVAFLAL